MRTHDSNLEMRRPNSPMRPPRHNRSKWLIIGAVLLAALLVVVLAAHFYKLLPSSSVRQRGSVDPGLPPTTSGINVGLVFNYNVADLQEEVGKIDYVWGSSRAAEPPSVYNAFYYPYDRERSTQRNLAWFQANHPEWIEYKCDRTSPAYEYGDPHVPLDITNVSVLNYMMSTYIIPALHSGYGGIGFDNVNLDNVAGRCGHFTANHTWVQQFAGTQNDPAFAQAVLNWAAFMYKHIHAAFASATVAMNFLYDSRLASLSYQLFRYMDIDFDESGFSRCCVSGSGAYTESGWLSYMQAIQHLSSLGHGYFSENQEPERFSNVSNEEVQWVLANYLLVKSRYSYVNISGPQEFGYLFWRHEYEAPIGTPTGTMTATQDVYVRSFTGGLAIVNPSAKQTRTIHVATNTYVDLYGNLVASGVLSLPPHSGVVLLTM